MANLFIGSGATASVIRISHNRALKCAFSQHEFEIEHEHGILKHLGPHRGIVKHFNEPHEGRISLKYYPYEVRKYVGAGNPISLELWTLRLAKTLVFIHTG